MTEPYALIGEVFAPEAIGHAAVVVQVGKISGVLASPCSRDLPARQRTVSGVICPGFMELQIDGAFEIDVSPEVEGLWQLAAELPQTGTTSFLPTAISWPAERYQDFLEALEEASMAYGGTSLENAVRMATQTPAEILGLESKGKIAAGAEADLVILTQESFVEETVVAGETVYRREGEDRAR